MPINDINLDYLYYITLFYKIINFSFTLIAITPIVHYMN